MDIAGTSPIERIARMLAAHAPSRNGEGDMDSAGDAVDASTVAFTVAFLMVVFFGILPG